MQFHLWTNLWHLSLCQAKSLCSVTHILFHCAFALHVQLPVFLPFQLLCTVKQNRGLSSFTLRQWAVILIYKWQSLPLLLTAEEVPNFYLSPNKICLLYLVCDRPPWPSLHDSLDKVGIISRPDINFKFSLIFLDRLNNKPIRKSNFPQKISVVVSIKGRFKLDRSFEDRLINFVVLDKRYSFFDVCRMIWLHLLLYVLEPQ